MQSSATPHLVLLGDSLFDNGVYVHGKPAVIDQLKTKITSKGWRATLLAVDGNVINDVERQLKRLPADATHLFISVGGNNGLRYMAHLNTEVKTVSEALGVMAKLRGKFLQDYTAMLDQVLKLKLHTTLCSIYNPRKTFSAFTTPRRFPSAVEQTVCETGLCFLNDVIFSAAAQHHLPLIDLKTACNDDADYANAIEPGVQGGEKITDNIVAVVDGHDFKGLSKIYSHGKEKKSKK